MLAVVAREGELPKEYWADAIFERDSTLFLHFGEVAFDTTRVKANNSRYKTRTAKTLQEKLQALDELFEQRIRNASEIGP